MAHRVYILHVTHSTSPADPAVIYVGDQHTLEDLHYSIQHAFNWDADHLYSFFMSGRAWDQSSEYAAVADPMAIARSPRPLASQVDFEHLGLNVGSTFLYLFDYGDEHHFDVRVERISQSDQPLTTPQIERLPAAPPQQYPDEEWEDEEALFDQEDLDLEEEGVPSDRAALTEGELEYDWGGDGSDLNEPVRAHVEAALVPTTAPYPAPLDQLLSLGSLLEMKDADEHITALDLKQEHVPDLVRMVRDRALNTAMGDTAEVWAPAHALNALQDLDITAFIPDLIPVFDLDDDWMPPTLAEMLGAVGAPALAPVRRYLQDRTRWIYGRSSAADAIKQIGTQHPDLRGEAIQILSDELSQAQQNDPGFNGFLIGYLLDLQAVEALPVIRRAFELRNVDEMIVGGWSDVLEALGVAPDPADPLLQPPPRLERMAAPPPSSRPAPATQAAPPPSSRPLPPPLRETPSPAKDKQKAKRKMASASRKANQPSKKKKKKRK